MYSKIKGDYISWILLIGIIILLLEISFSNSGLLFALIVSIGLIYIGRKWLPKTSGKVLLGVGIFFFFANVFSMFTFKFILIAILVHLAIQYAQSKKEPTRIRPIIKEPEVSQIQTETVIKKKALFHNVLFGEQRTPEHVYEWNDVNIQAGVGDIVIDLSYTVLPKAETVIFIRNFIGNVKILIPYDIEVNINHNVIAGSANIFNVQDQRVFNQTINVQTPEYEKAEQRIKIFTSFAVGDIEVKRV